MNTFDAGTYITLEDKATGTFQKLNDNPVYSFTSDVNADVNRFALHFKNATSVPDPTTAESFSITLNSGIITVVTPQTVNAEILVSNMLGQLVLRGKTNGGSATVLNANTLPNGVYVVSLTGNNKVVSKKIVINK